MPVDDKPELDKPKMNEPSPYADPNVAGLAGKRRKPALSPDIQAQIGRKLAAVYDEVLYQPVPDRFRLLLEQLDAKTAISAKEGDDR